MKITYNPLNFCANRMNQKEAQFINNKLSKAKNIDIICHEATDRDSIHSAIAMSDYLENIGKQTRIIVQQNLKNLKINKKDYNIIQAQELTQTEQKPNGAILCVDFSKKDKVTKNVYKYIKNSKNVLCIDHHNEPNLSDEYILIEKPLKEYETIKTVSSFYIDASAKSATSIIYRFFEALGINIDNKTAYNLFCGFVDDGVKNHLIDCSAQKGEIVPTKKLLSDKNAYEVFNSLEEKLSTSQIQKIARNIDIMSSLTPKEKAFQQYLYNKLKFSKNGKIAYIEIPPNDKKWEELGRDNSRTSTILNRFRQDVLANKFNDERLENVDAVITFYEAQGSYRLSVHSKSKRVLEFFKYIEDNAVKKFTRNSGGHPTRGGGKIRTTNPKECHGWVMKIISCSDFYD